MAEASYIPTGRTSLVKKGTVALQVQTEYAARPNPRITTTVLNQGQVVHKIERKVSTQVNSLEEKDRTEASIQKQHSKVLEIIERNFKPATLRQALATAPESRAEETANIQPSEVETPARPLGIIERLGSVPGVRRVYKLGANGDFVTPGATREFRKNFGLVFKNLIQVLSVFTEAPGFSVRREQGVYEVESNRLYLVSQSDDFYFVYVNPPALSVDYEQALREASEDD